MKQLSILLLVLGCIVTFSSCGNPNALPTDSITWGQAFEHAITTTGYKISLGTALLILVSFPYFFKKHYDVHGMDTVCWILLLVGVVSVFCLILATPSSWLNTTVADAARGVYF